MSRADFLIELGTEELPPKALLTLRDALAGSIEAQLRDASLTHADIVSYATPRRLAVLVPDLALNQPVQRIENRGPPVRMAYDGEGLPTKATVAFAAKCGVSADELSTVTTDKGEWLFYSGEAPGLATVDLIAAIVTKALNDLPIPRRMRWGSSDTEFVRPAHWLVMLLGDEIIPATLLGIKAGRETYGHRFHFPGSITLQNPASYSEALRNIGMVIASFEERRELVKNGAVDAAKKLGGEAIIHADVLDEVTALVEWPVPVTGRFDDAFLRLPPEVLVSTLQDHQRYFPVQGTQGLMAAFVTTSNIASNQPEEVRRGNERVVAPRLSDAAFFWDKDSATPLAGRLEALGSVVYQQGLGSLQDKSARVAHLAAQLTTVLKADAEHVSRAAALARTDLLTDMVGEFPELQGRMGYYYALHDGESEAVATAIEEQYLPRHSGDRLPDSAGGKALAIADRLDTLAGIFVLGKRPSGNKDPYGLRRQALGLVRILIEGAVDVDLINLLERAVALQPRTNGKPASSEKIAGEISEFVLDRMRAWYLEGQAPGFNAGDVSAEMFASVQAREPRSPLDFHQRLVAVQRFMTLESASSLAAANKRIANILKKVDENTGAQVDAKLFDAAAETSLHEAVTALLSDHAADLAARDYENVFKRLSGLRKPVDSYFDEVMVMADDEQLRANRLAQLRQLRKLFLDVADISCISSS